jgi:hypothetical protein
VYSADPKTHADAQRYRRLTFDEAIVKKLMVMDATALTLCRDQRLPINVFRHTQAFRPETGGHGRGRGDVSAQLKLRRLRVIRLRSRARIEDEPDAGGGP